MEAGACGVAVGRNVWQSSDPDGIAQSLEKLLFGEATIGKAMEVLS